MTKKAPNQLTLSVVNAATLRAVKNVAATLGNEAPLYQIDENRFR